MIEPAGSLVIAEDLGLAKARALALYLNSGQNPYVDFVSAYREEGGPETVVFEARLELSQVRKYPILPSERVAVSFQPDDDSAPEVVSLREDFPSVPHLNERTEEFPRSLCLYDASYDAVRMKWTAAGFIARIREWLSLTAEGDLHQADQPLEPLILGMAMPLIMPASFFQPGADQHGPRSFGVVALGGDDHVPTAYALRETQAGQQSTHQATVMLAGVREQGSIRRTPANLRDLVNLCEENDFRLGDVLRQQMPGWKDDVVARKLHLILVILFPKVRAAGSEVKEWDTLAFFLHASIEEIGERLGLWQRAPSGGGLGALLIGAVETTEAIPVSVLNPMVELTRERAALFNGVEVVDQPYVMVGVGSLGSRLMELLARKAFGTWTLIDNDILLPHNGARHLLPAEAAGYPKVLGVRTQLKPLYADETVTDVLRVDILRPKDRREDLIQRLESAAGIVDCSADVPVARHLAKDINVAGRRISVFLNPAGEDLVILAEDRQRRHRLDELEMQYYGWLVREKDLASHLGEMAARVRYGRSCRDLSAVISNDAITRNAAIASKVLPVILHAESAFILLWRGNVDASVERYEEPVRRSVEVEVRGVTIIVSEGLLDRLKELRAGKLPNETGGAILGEWDHSRGRLYIIGALSAPADSKEEPSGFVRGMEAFADEIHEAIQRTGRMAAYVGEWHSHPDGYPASPSALDRKLGIWLQERLQLDGLDSLMLIVGETSLHLAFGDGSQGATWKFQN